MKARPIVVQTSYREVFNQLEDAILRGELKIDEPLPTEAELCDILQVKRSTVREGIRLLEQSGLVTRNSARRLVVSAPDASRSSENIIRSVTLNKVTREELWRVQRELEALASRLACDNISKPLLEALADNIEQTRVSRDDPKTIVKIDMEFHRLIAHASNNRALTLARDPLGLLLYASSDFVITRLAQSTDRLIAAHQRIYDSIAANDPENAAKWMLKHMDDFKRGCIMAGAVFDDPILDFVDIDVLSGLTEALRK
jgi:DNA-binding FadR family transcriptional regulator